MTPTPQRAHMMGNAETAAAPESVDGELLLENYAGEFDQPTWEHRVNEERGAGGRQVLGGTLIALAALWIAYVAWTAGRALAAAPLSSPLVAQWLATAAGPLGLLGLA